MPCSYQSIHEKNQINWSYHFLNCDRPTLIKFRNFSIFTTFDFWADWVCSPTRTLLRFEFYQAYNIIPALNNNNEASKAQGPQSKFLYFYFQYCFLWGLLVFFVLFCVFLFFFKLKSQFDRLRKRPMVAKDCKFYTFFSKIRSLISVKMGKKISVNDDMSLCNSNFQYIACSGRIIKIY